jgi:aspartyl-tRNA(Asn)/glutamyl-tRNA(Gln) amidotransferase subunit A
VAAFSVDLQYPSAVAGRLLASPIGWFPFTFPFAMTNQPAISVPCGTTAEGLPVGLQIVGRRFAEAAVLRAAAAFEAARPWSARRPPL